MVQTRLSEQPTGVEGPTSDGAPVDCHHCGASCGRSAVEAGGLRFCCRGCLTVHELLQESGLGHYYQLNRHPGVQIGEQDSQSRWSFLDDPEVERQLLNYSDTRSHRVTFHVPSIHCVACVWLLENLFCLSPGIGASQVNFARREVTLTYDPARLRLSGVAALLTSLGYEPALTLGTLEKGAPDRVREMRVLQTGVAGFAFGNIMLFSLPGYLGLDSLSGPLLEQVFGWLSLTLALPVLAFSASDYWRSALASFRQRTLTLDVPIVLGLVALYGQSFWQIATRTGVGYLDTLAGLVFFLLCGRWFQDVTHARLAFDRDYRSFFPLAVTRCTEGGGRESVALSGVSVGDRLELRHGELVPVDAMLVTGVGRIDYSFVTGEAEPVERNPGELVYAGGRQVGGLITVETVKPVSQSYLASLWSHEAFRKTSKEALDSLTHRFSRRFTVVVLTVALAAGIGWILAGDTARGIKAFVSVLIVACPCALALAAPFALGTAQRLLVRAQVFLKNAQVLERLARIDRIVFDKTGTLTVPSEQTVRYEGEPLSGEELAIVGRLVRQSVHPLAVRLAVEIGVGGDDGLQVEEFRESQGLGLEGRVQGRQVILGSARFLAERGIEVGGGRVGEGSVVELAIAGAWRGRYELVGKLRQDAGLLISDLTNSYKLALVSGDRDRDRARFEGLFGAGSELRFQQSPLDKLEYVRQRQAVGERVMMVGDGLNDAGALRQSDVGVALVERVGTFSPASDVILASVRLSALGSLLELARRTVRVVIFCFGVSTVYNGVGLGVAAAGWLSPVICAVLMPLSSVSVVLVACGATVRAVRRCGLGLDLGQGGKASGEADLSQRNV